MTNVTTEISEAKRRGTLNFSRNVANGFKDKAKISAASKGLNKGAEITSM